MVIPIGMEWRDLLFEHWPIDPAAVDPLLPDQLALETHDGAAWVSIVPLVNLDLRPPIFPREFGHRLPEINVRTYVRYQDTSAVYFFSLDADGLLSVLGSRLAHHLPYYWADIEMHRSSQPIRFTSQRRHPGARPAAFEATYQPTGESFPAPEDPLAAFLLERYRLYTESPSGQLRYTDVEHDSWTLYEANAAVKTNTMLNAIGIDKPDSTPVYHYSPGVEVRTSRSRSATSSG